MRVLMILDNLSRDSGVSSIVMNLYKNINSNNVKIDFLAFKEGNDSYLKMIKEKGSKVYILPNPLSLKTFVKSIKIIKKFFQEHSKEYDVVHLHSPSLNEFTLKYAKKYGITNRIIHSHSTMTSPIKKKKYIQMFLQRNVTKYANHFFSCSTEASEFLYGKEFCIRNEIYIVKNAVDTKKFMYSEEQAKQLTQEFDIEGKRIAIHVSNFSKIKNVSFLVCVLKRLISLTNDYKFIFVGDGPTKKDVEHLVNEFGLADYCIFTGRRNDVERLLNCGDVLLLPSIKEGLPVAVIEAQANGMKCLVSDTITREADVGDVTYLPLKEEEWIQKLIMINKRSNHERIYACEKFNTTEFNILNEAKRMELKYLSMRGGRA